MQQQQHPAMQNAMQQIPTTQGQNLPFPPQLQHQMQASPIPGMQQQHPMNMNMNMNMDGMMGGMGGNPQQPNMHQQSMQNQQQNLRVQPGHQPRPNQGPAANTENLTPQDQRIIANMAAQMAQSMGIEQQNALRQKLRSQNPNLDQKGGDPIAYYFRTHAIRRFREQRMAQIAQAHNMNQLGHPMPPGAQPQQPSQPQSQRTENTNVPGLQGAAHPGMIGNVNHFQGQQADGLRSQEAGQLVVPASNPSGFNMQQKVMRGGQTPASRPMTNQGLVTPQQQQLQQMQQNQGSQLQQHQNMRGNALRPGMGPQGQNGQPPSSQPQNPMAMLNQPAPPQVQGVPNRPASVQRQVPPSPANGQQGLPQQAASTQNLPPQLQRVLASVPPELRAVILNSPRERWQELLAKFFQSRRPGAGGMQAPHMQQAASQPGQSQQAQGGRFPGETDVGSEPMQQSVSAGPMPQQRPNQNPTPQMLADQQRRRQQSSVDALQRTQSQPQEPTLQTPSAQDLGKMDALEFPPQLRQSFPIPQGVTKYFQLKQWVAANQDTTLTPAKILGIQTMQWQRFHERHRRMQNSALGTMPPNGPAQTGQPQGMRQQGQPHMAAQNQPNLSLNGRGISQITPQTIQHARNTISHFHDKSDIEIASALQKHQLQRQQDIANRQGQRPGGIGASVGPSNVPQPSQSQQIDQGARSQPPGQGGISAPMQDQQRQPPTAQAQRALSGTNNIQMADSQTQKATPQMSSSQQAIRNLKRPNEDGADGGSLNNLTKQMQAQSSIQQPTEDQFRKMTPEQQQEYLSRRRQATRPAVTGLSEQDAAHHLPSMWQEILQTTPKPGRLPLNGNDHTRMVAILTLDKTHNMLKRVEPLMKKYFQHTGDRAGTMDLMKQRYIVSMQYKHGTLGTTFEPVDQFSITPQQLEQCVKNIELKFKEVSDMFGGPTRMAHAKAMQQAQAQAQASAQGKANLAYQQHQAQILANAQTQAKAQAHMQASNPPQTHAGQTQSVPQQPLSAENLQQFQQQQDAQRAKRSGEIPAQPGASSPHNGHGTPVYGQLGGIKQEDLKLPPDPKRRKKNNQPAAPTTPRKTNASPQVQKKAEEPKHKCVVEGCGHAKKGFSSEAELEKHVGLAHKKEEQIEDPLAYMMDNVRNALGLDERGEPRVKSAKDSATRPQAQPMVSSVSKDRSIKQSSSAPMSREVSKAGLKAASPIAAANKSIKSAGKATVQTPTAKDKPTPIAGAAKKTQDAQQKMAPDSWNESPVSLSALQNTFGEFKTEPGFDDSQEWVAGFPMEMDMDDMMSAFVESDAWTKIQEPKTQDSSAASDQTKPSPAQNSDSDISKSDDLYIKIDPHVPLGEDWNWEDLIASDGEDVEMVNANDAKGVEGVIFDDFDLKELDNLGVEEDSWKEIDWEKVMAQHEAEKAKEAEEARKRGKR